MNSNLVNCKILDLESSIYLSPVDADVCLHPWSFYRNLSSCVLLLLCPTGHWSKSCLRSSFQPQQIYLRLSWEMLPQQVSLLPRPIHLAGGGIFSRCQRKPLSGLSLVQLLILPIFKAHFLKMTPEMKWGSHGMDGHWLHSSIHVLDSSARLFIVLQSYVQVFSSLFKLQATACSAFKGKISHIRLSVNNQFEHKSLYYMFKII